MSAAAEEMELMDAFTNALLTFQNPLLDVMLVVLLVVISQLPLFLCRGCALKRRFVDGFPVGFPILKRSPSQVRRAGGRQRK